MFGRRPRPDGSRRTVDPADRSTTTTNTAAGPPFDEAMTRSEEELRVATTDEEIGRVRLRKHVETEHVEQPVPLDTEFADVERIAVDPATDTGQVETLPDGSISVPVFREELVIEKRLVVHERIVVRKTRRRAEQIVEADLRREHITVDIDESVQDRVQR